MYGLKIYGEHGFMQYTSEDPIFALRSIKTLNLIGGREDPRFSTGSGKITTAKMNSRCDMIAVYSDVWTMMNFADNEVKLLQEFNGGAGQAKIFGFSNDSNTGGGKYGLELQGENGLVALNGKQLLKVIDAFTLPNNLKNWSYTAPSGKAIAAMVGGGFGHVRWFDRDGLDQFYKMLFRMPALNHIEVSHRKIATDYGHMPSGIEKQFDWYQNIPLSVAIIDITDILHFDDF